MLEFIQKNSNFFCYFFKYYGIIVYVYKLMNGEIMMTDNLLQKIIDLRNMMKLTKLYMADKIGIPINEYILFEAGKLKLSDEQLSRCLQTLGIGDVYERYSNITTKNGKFINIDFINSDTFNFGEVVDILGREKPNNLALLHIDENDFERRFTFGDISILSSMTANYFKSLGIKKGDRVMLVLKSSYQFWYILVALHKIGAVAVPSTHMLKKIDYEYRIENAEVSTIISVNNDEIISEIESCNNIDKIKNKICINGAYPNWYNFDNDVIKYGTNFKVEKTTNNDPMIIFFTSGTTNVPKGVVHSFTYPLSHIVTAKFWQNVNKNGLHYTMSDSGWAKFFWGKVYGQWLCEAPIFAYDYSGRFESDKILNMIEKYQITSVCAPATNYRMFNNIDLKKFNLSSVNDFTVAGEPLETNSYNKFCNCVNNQIRPAYGMTEAAMVTGNLINNENDPNTIGTLNSMYDTLIVDKDFNILENGEQGQLIIKNKNNNPGMLIGYLRDKKIISPLIDGYYHTGDVVYKDENERIHFVGRNDDIIKTSGYKVAPPEVEDIIMQLSYVKECAVIGIPDEIRGSIVSALIVLKEDIKNLEGLKEKIQKYVKSKTSPYKYPRKIVFLKELPKTISGKIDKGKIKKLSFGTC